MTHGKIKREAKSVITCSTRKLRCTARQILACRLLVVMMHLKANKKKKNSCPRVGR